MKKPKINFSKVAGLGEKLGLKNARPPFEGFYIYGLLFFVAYLTADLATFSMRGAMLPVGGVSKSRRLNRRNVRKKQGSLYGGIRDKNIFNADHVVPPSLGEKQKGGEIDDNTKPTLSSLPLDLVGTIVHGDGSRSVSTIQIKGKKEIFPYKVEEKVESMALIKDIRRHRVIFRNLRSGKMEYIEIKENAKIRLNTSGPRKPIEKIGVAEATNFNFKRSEINKHLENLPQILQDAKAVPYIAPGSGGEVSGFKLVAIKTGSVYEKLGLKRGDIIKGVNGELVDTPQKAMELYQALKNSDSIQLEISRGGSSTTLNYTVQ